jgi:hypothetical protein
MKQTVREAVLEERFTGTMDFYSLRCTGSAKTLNQLRGASLALKVEGKSHPSFCTGAAKTDPSIVVVPWQSSDHYQSE